MPHPFALGALRDVHDSRDRLYGQVVAPVPFPDSVDYEPLMSPVKNQGRRGACVAFATCAVKEYQERVRDLSEEFVYDQVRQPGGGASIRDAMKVLVKAGVCSEALMPYRPRLSDATVRPFRASPRQLDDAFRHKAKGYARLLSMDDLCRSLAGNGPCAIGVDWLSGWFRPKASYDGYPLLQPGAGKAVGGHALAVCSYYASKGLVKVKNSWDATWGKNGYALIDMNALDFNRCDAWSTYDLAA